MIRPLHDLLLVELEPVKEFSKGGIVLVAPKPVRTAKVVRAGPGRHYVDKKFVPTLVQPGDRVVFFDAVLHTKQGKQLSWSMLDGLELIRETDVLMVLSGDVEVSV